MTLSIRSSFIALYLCCLSVSELIAQDDLSDLSLEELAHVDVQKKTAGLLDYRTYNPDNTYLGLMIPYSKQTEYSIELKNAVDLAIGEINSEGGVLGKRLDFIAADDGAFKELTVLFTDSLVRTYRISALIGPSGSARLIHLAKTYLPDHPLLIISPSASSDEISHLEDHDLVWRTMPSDAQQMMVSAHYIFNDLKKKSIAILYAQDAYGRGLCEEFKRNFKGVISSEVNFSPLVNLKTFDFTEKLNELFKARPEVIFFATGGKDAAIITNRISKGTYIGPTYNPIIFGGETAKSDDFVKSADPVIIEGMYGTALSSGNTDEFKNKYYKKYNRYPVSSDSERSYDIVYILALAMEKARSVRYMDIKNELRSVTEGGEEVGPGDFAAARSKLQLSKDIYYKGVSGNINFDINGDLSSGIFEVWKIVDGKFTTIKTVHPGDLK
jgi:branched-chain amino acid transport system substrate-binding protein